MTPRLLTAPTALHRPGKPQQRRPRLRLGWLCVAASLGAHGVLLALVLPGRDQAVPPVAPLAADPVPPSIAVTLLPKPPEQPVPVVDSLAVPAPVSAPPRPIDAIAAPLSPQPVPPPDPVAVPPEPVAPEPVAVAPEPPPLENPAPAPPAPYANFPHLAGAQASCEGGNDCWRSPVTMSWRSAAGDLQTQLEAQGYTVDNVTGEVLSLDSGVRVYAVSKPGEPGYYLNLVSVRDGVLYTMTTEPMTSDQVLALQRS